MVMISIVLVVLLPAFGAGFAFQAASAHGVASFVASPGTTDFDTSLRMSGNLFGNIGKQLFGGKAEDESPSKRLFDIEVESMKVGGLRFTLGLYLIGQQSNPEKGSWKANQADDGVLDFFFKDGTGALSISFSDKMISFDRWGPSPSLQYQLQESLILHGVLDELHTLAFEGDDIKEDDRLLKLKEPGDSIENARKTLPAKKA